MQKPPLDAKGPKLMQKSGQAGAKNTVQARKVRNPRPGQPGAKPSRGAGAAW